MQDILSPGPVTCPTLFLLPEVAKHLHNQATFYFPTVVDK